MESSKDFLPSQCLPHSAVDKFSLFWFTNPKRNNVATKPKLTSRGRGWIHRHIHLTISVS